MVQNLNTKIAFILALLILSVYVLFTKDITLGLDLSGGSSLRYRLPVDEAEQDPQGALDETVEVLRTRIDMHGLKEIPIRSQGEDEIIIELPGMPKSEVDNIIQVIQTQGNMEWFIVAETEQDVDAPEEVFLDLEVERKKLVEFLKALEAKDGGWDLETDLTPLDVSMTINGREALFRWLPMDAKVLIEERNATVPEKKNGTLDSLRKVPEQIDEQVALTYFNMVKIFKDPTWRFSGRELSLVRGNQNEAGQPAVSFEFQPDRARDFGAFTRAHKDKCLAIILDGKIMTEPRIQEELPGQGQITGPQPNGFTRAEQKDLITVLRSGSLPIKPILLSRQDIGPTLGENSIKRGQLAAIIGLSAVFVFIIIYYFLAGLVASISLAFNLTVLSALLVFLEATLTLPGIAGIVLTVGMAVDANILIFERIREEKDKGKTLGQSVKNGFERAFLTIVDANATTFITGFILFQVGTGPIKGFAVTLMIGICTSLFSALVLSKAVFALMLEKGLGKLNMLRFLRKVNVNFIDMRKQGAVLSVILIIVGLVLFFSEDDSKYGLDFTGGYNIHLVCTADTTQAEVQTELGAHFPNVQVITVKGDAVAAVAGDTNIFNVKIKGAALEAAGLESRPDQDATAEAETADPAGSEDDAEAVVSDAILAKIREVLGDRILQDPISDLTLTPKPETESTVIKVRFHFVEAPATEAELAGGENPNNIYQKNIAEALGDFVEGQGWIFTPDGLRLDLVAEYKLSSTITPERIKAGLVRRLKEAADEGLPIHLSDPFPMTEFIGPTVGTELRDKAVQAILGALIAIIVYIRFRFKEYKYGFAACVALVHDVLITLGAIALIRLTGLVDIEIDLPIIAAFMTIIGYSLNDTIVVFDRIRENLPRVNRPFTEVVNLSINQTLSRTILTSLTTLLVLAILFALNYGQRNVLEGFSFAMIIGVIVGTYSSIFVASPTLIWIHGKGGKTK